MRFQQFTEIRDYPIFSLTGDGQNVICSGGGGADHGIENLIEVINVESHQQNSRTVISDPLGLVDDIKYNKKKNIYCGGLAKECIIFRTSSNGIEMLARWKTVPISAKKITVQDRCAISPSGEYVATTAENGNLSIFRLWEIDGQFSSEFVKDFDGLHKAGISDIEFSPDDSLVITCGKDCCVKAISIPTLSIVLVNQFPCPDRPNEQKFLTPRNLRFYNVVDKAKGCIMYSAILTGHAPRHVSYLMRCTLSISGIDTASIHMNSYSRFNRTSMLNCAAISWDEKLIGVASNRHIWIIESSSLNVLTKVKRGGESNKSDLPATGITFINNDKKLVVGSADYTIEVLEVPSNLQRQPISRLLLNCLSYIITSSIVAAAAISMLTVST